MPRTAPSNAKLCTDPDCVSRRFKHSHWYDWPEFSGRKSLMDPPAIEPDKWAAAVDDTLTMEQATDQVYYWADQRLEARDRAFDDLLGWVAGRAITGDPSAAETLRRIRDRAERS